MFYVCPICATITKETIDENGNIIIKRLDPIKNKDEIDWDHLIPKKINRTQNRCECDKEKIIKEDKMKTRKIQDYSRFRSYRL